MSGVVMVVIRIVVTRQAGLDILGGTISAWAAIVKREFGKVKIILLPCSRAKG
jgi:hypothetical protein